MAALWPPRAPFGILSVFILGPILIIFLMFFRPPQNLVFELPYNSFACFKHPKNSHFRTPFQTLFRPHFGTPFGRAFWPVLAPQGADPASPCRFWSLFGTPWDRKWSLGALRGGQGRPKREVPRSTVEVPFASWTRSVFRRGPASHSYRFWDPLGSPRRPFGIPLGDIRLVSGRRG